MSNTLNQTPAPARTLSRERMLKRRKVSLGVGAAIGIAAVLGVEGPKVIDAHTSKSAAVTVENAKNESTIKVPTEGQPYKSYTLDIGDTVWSVADEAYPAKDFPDLIRADLIATLVSQLPKDAEGNPIDPSEAQRGQGFKLPANAEGGHLVTPEPATTSVHIAKH